MLTPNFGLPKNAVFLFWMNCEQRSEMLKNTRFSEGKKVRKLSQNQRFRPFFTVFKKL